MWIFWTIFLVVIGGILMIYSWTGDGWQGIAAMYSTVLLLIAINISSRHLNPQPTVLDVYRGNTELKIISVNGIPTDTIVVFKNK